MSKIFKISFGLIVLAELISFFGYYNQAVNYTVFFAISLAALILCLNKLEYGLWILLAELFIGSFGYLFYFESSGLKISIRLALWLIVLSVWLAETIINWVKNKKLSVDFFRSAYRYYFLALFVFIAWGLINAFVNKNTSGYIFQDFERWLYFLLIFPAFSVLRDKENVKRLEQIFFAATAWLSVKTIALFYIFSHDFGGLILDVYRWVRLSGVGEITPVQGGFNRVFIQSQIFILIGLFFLWFRLIKRALGGKKFSVALFGLFVLDFSAILISFSRSFWIGLAAGIIFVWWVAIFKIKTRIKQFIVFNFLAASGVIASAILIAAILFFPAPKPLGGFNAADLFGQRATELTGEAGASSRWQLLTPLWNKIIVSPITGKGFGATVTYFSKDPRVLASSPKGEYTTYAFEWGWLDVWLKLGIFGLLAYLILFAKIIFDSLKATSYRAWSYAAGLAVLAAVNIFSPYVNHPLGIGFLLIAASAMALRDSSN